MTSLRRTRPWCLLGVLLILLAAAAGCGGGGEAADDPAAAVATEAAPAQDSEVTATAETGEATQPAPASITVALDWFPNPDHVSLYYALDHGSWDDQTLDVELKTPSDPAAGLKLVATGKFDLAIYYSQEMFFADELPVIAVGSLIPVPLSSLIALADSKVTGLDTIKGATIAYSGGEATRAEVDSLRQKLGLAEDDVKLVNVGFNLVPSLLTGKADAILDAYFNIEATEIEIETGQRPTVIRMEELGLPTTDELVIVANRDRLDSDPAYADAVRRFLVGMIDGAERAQADEQGAIENMKQVTDYSAEEIEGMVPDTLPLLTPPNGRSIGCFDLDAWRAYGQWMVENELIEQPVELSTIATNDYVPGC